MLIQQPAMVEFRELLCGHVFAHVQLGMRFHPHWMRHLCCSGCADSEISEGRKSLRRFHFQMSLG